MSRQQHTKKAKKQSPPQPHTAPEQSQAECGGATGTEREPPFDGKEFHSPIDGTPLRVLVLERRDIFDAPNIILVLDPTQGRAFAGTMGGFIRPGTNPFHGFYGSAQMERPNDKDRAAVRFDGDVAVSTATGEPLDRVGHESPPTEMRDGLSSTWYFDRATYTVYRFVTGGIRGVRNQLESVIHVPRLDESAAAPHA